MEKLGVKLKRLSSREVSVSLITVLILIFVSCYSLVFVARVISNSEGEDFYSVNEYTEFTYNFTINNRDLTSDLNISLVNITLPEYFNFTILSNGTDSEESNFVKTNNTLSWIQDGLIMNQTTQHFWFKASAPEGEYNITIQTFNSVLSEEKNISVTVNPYLSLIISPIVNNSYNSDELNLTFESYENLTSLQYSLNNASNVTIDKTTFRSPADPNETAHYIGPFYQSTAFDSKDNYIYVISSSNSSLLVFDISGENATNPSLVYRYGNSSVFYYPTAIIVNGDYLYAYSDSYYSGGLITFDIRGENITHPVPINRYTNNEVIPGTYDFAIGGNYLYVLSEQDVIATFDITGENASNPVLISFGETINGEEMVVGENYLYVTSSQNDALVTFNISGENARLPIQVASYNDSFLNQVSGLVLRGDYLYVFNSYYLSVFNASGEKASNPQKIRSISTTWIYGRATSSDNFLYVPSYWGLKTFNISGEKASFPYLTTEEAYLNFTSYSNSAKIIGDYLYATSSAGIMIFDLTYKGGYFKNFSFNQGDNSLDIYASDEEGDYTHSSYNIFVDSINPSINITKPLNNITYSYLVHGVNFTVSDANLDSCWYSNDSSNENISTDCDSDFIDLAWGEGQHNLTIWANDSLDNLGHTSINFTIDTTSFPQINITSPKNTSIYNFSRVVVFNASLSVLNRVNSCYLSVDNGENVTMTLGNNKTLASYNYTSLASGVYNATIFCNILDGEISSATEENFVVDLSSIIPKIELIQINPPLYPYTNISAYSGYTYPDLSEVNSTFYFLWYLNGTNVENDTIYNAKSNSLITVYLNTSKRMGDVINLVAYVDDGLNLSPPHFSDKIILGVNSSLRLTNSSLIYGETLFCDSVYCYSFDNEGYFLKINKAFGLQIYSKVEGHTKRLSNVSIWGISCDTNFCYGSDTQGYFLKINKASGLQIYNLTEGYINRWSLNGTDAFYCDPDFCYAGDDEGYFLKINKTSGEQIFNQTEGYTNKPTEHYLDSISCDDTYCYATESEGYFIKINKITGEHIYNTTENYTLRLSPSLSALYCDSLYCYAGDYWGYFFKIDKITGEQIYNRTVNYTKRISDTYINSLYCDSDFCYAGDDNGYLLKLNHTSGVQVYNATLGYTTQLSNNALYSLYCDSSYCYSGDNAGYFKKFFKAESFVVEKNPYTNETGYEETNKSDDTGDAGAGSDSTLDTTNWTLDFTALNSSSNTSQISLSESQLQGENSYSLKQFGEIKFVINNENHTLYVNNFSGEVVTFIMYSSPQKFILTPSSEKKFSFANGSYYDLLVRLNSVRSGTANITIKAIHELISSNVQTTSVEEEVTAKQLDLIWAILIMILLVVIGIISLFLHAKLKKIKSVS